MSRSVGTASALDDRRNVKGVKTGIPSGLYLLFASEMWERFGFYTAAAIMTLYLQDGGIRLVQDRCD